MEIRAREQLFRDPNCRNVSGETCPFFGEITLKDAEVGRGGPSICCGQFLQLKIRDYLPGQRCSAGQIMYTYLTEIQEGPLHELDFDRQICYTYSHADSEQGFPILGKEEQP